MNTKAWSEQEDTILREQFPTGSAKSVDVVLRDNGYRRSMIAIYARAGRLGVESFHAAKRTERVSPTDPMNGVWRAARWPVFDRGLVGWRLAA